MKIWLISVSIALEKDWKHSILSKGYNLNFSSNPKIKFPFTMNRCEKIYGPGLRGLGEGIKTLVSLRALDIIFTS